MKLFKCTSKNGKTFYVQAKSWDEANEIVSTYAYNYDQDIEWRTSTIYLVAFLNDEHNHIYEQI